MIILLFFLYILLSLALIYLSEKLLKIQYLSDRKSWKEDGCPRGMIFNPKGSSITACWRLSFKKTGDKYKWALNSVEASKYLSLYQKLANIFLWYTLAFVPISFLSIIFSA
ncbi:hypothetical protein [Shewanella woodyi]|uniref:hypothetical protein n=1 Tax=Shewanella woodyi TaxID=60961 RepID=UPI0037491F5D